MSQVSSDGGRDPGSQAPGCEPWYGLAPAAGVQYHHGRRPDQPVHRERHQPRRHPRLPVRTHQFERVLVRDHRGHNRHRPHRQRCSNPHEPVRHRPCSARQPPTTNRSSSPYPAASRSASTIAVIAWFRVNNGGGDPTRPTRPGLQPPRAGCTARSRSPDRRTRRSSNRHRLELPYRTSPSTVRPGKPVTNQVTTAPADAGPGQSESDSPTALNCRDATHRDPLRRDECPWHGGGLGFESP